MWTAMLICTAAVVILPSPRAVDAAGIFELRLKSFVNEYGKDNNGNCCSGVKSATGECASVCKTRFRVCLKQYQATIDTKSPCTYGDVMTPVLGENVVNFNPNVALPFFTNPIRFPFNFSWPGTFSLIIEAYHEDVDNVTHKSENVLITRQTTQRWLDIGPMWNDDEHRSQHSRMSYEYRVTCAPNYYGKSCERYCNSRRDNFGHWECTETGERICISGWEGDYCDKAQCLPGCKNGKCDNKPNECHCQKGWTGKYCDQCEPYPGCMHGTCTQPWQCLCEEGWGGLFCNQDLNYCTNHKPCHNGGTCFNTGEGSYTCSCAPGFTGTDCQTVPTDCEASPCLNGGTCSMTQNSKSASLESRGANVVRNYTCSCPTGWSGHHCEVNSRSCRDSPCASGASCEDDPLKGYKCLCPAGYGGADCDKQINECSSNPCANNATCVDRVDGFSCDCPVGFSGDRCEHNIDDCVQNPCLNGATCVDQVNQFRCKCVPGYVGKLCQDKVDYCRAKPCANGGTCFSDINDYRCSCKPGFTAKDCSVDVDECESSPCQNGATCRDRVNGYVCECRDGWRGENCAEEGRGVEPALRSSWPGSLSKHVASAEARDAGLTTEHVVVIATLSAAVPVFAIVAAVAVMCMKRRQKREQAKADEEARLQNERNAVHSSLGKQRGGSQPGPIKGWGASKSDSSNNDSAYQSDAMDGACAGYKPEPVLHPDVRTRTIKQINTEAAAAHRASQFFQKDKECTLGIGISVGILDPKRTSTLFTTASTGSPSSCTASSDASLLKRPATIAEGPPGGGGGDAAASCGVYVINDHYRHDAAALATEV